MSPDSLNTKIPGPNGSIPKEVRDMEFNAAAEKLLKKMKSIGNICGRGMLSHDLAKILLEAPNLPIATHANNHTYISGSDSEDFCCCRVGLLDSHCGDHIILGNISKRNLNASNYYVKEMIHGDAPEEWHK